ncbi:MAG: (d)CMP kinase [Erysipelotrichaceae bacterium]|nr:(d)CMP kinase [Erysipelotrichaceae bacterium]
MRINIAIDGPSASGKSTVARELCERLGYKHLDTGAMYRCVALKVVNDDIDITNDKKLKKALKEIDIRIDDEGKVFLNGEDVSLRIRTDEISMMASNVSTKKVVRDFLVKLQQKIASEKGYVMDGRDIGTVVLPNAELKIYLTASVEARAKRRYLENKEKGLNSDMQTLKNEIIARDYQDTHRKNSPLRQAKDAILVDSSDMSKEEVVEEVMRLAAKFIEE